MTLDDLRALQSDELSTKTLLERGDPLPGGIVADPLMQEQAAEPRRTRKEFAFGFYRDREWLFQGFRETQPETFHALMDASDLHLFVTEHKAVEVTLLTWVIESEGRAFQVKLQGFWKTESQLGQDPTSHRDYLSSLPSLGHELALAYSTFCHGFRILSPENLNSIYGPLPRMPMMSEQIFSTMMLSRGFREPDASPRQIKSVLKKDFAKLYKQFPYLKAQHKEDPKFEMGASRALRLVLQTRADPRETPGDSIIRQTPSRARQDQIHRDSDGNPILYRVKDYDWDNFQPLARPAEAIDNYVAHMLRNRPERFDFDPYCA